MLDTNRVLLATQPTIFNVEPGTWLRYTITATNQSSTLPMHDPVFVDLLPNMLTVDIQDVTFNANGTGLQEADKGTFTNADGVYAYYKLLGDLPANTSVTLTIEGMVKNNAIVSNETSMTNKAYLTSTTLISKSVTNPFGTAFTAVGGMWPGSTLNGAMLGAGSGDSYQAVYSEVSVNLVQNSSLKIYKLVAANVTGMGNYASANDYAIASLGNGSHSSDTNAGRIRYQIILSNGVKAGTRDATNIRIVDKLPVFGDSDITNSGAARNSKWPVTYDGLNPLP